MGYINISTEYIPSPGTPYPTNVSKPQVQPVEEDVISKLRNLKMPVRRDRKCKVDEIDQIKLKIIDAEFLKDMDGSWLTGK